MPKSLINVCKQIKPKVLTAAEKKTQKILTCMRLKELHDARLLAQEQYAKVLKLPNIPEKNK
jgi:DNA-binding transcriptional regulator YiaG